MIRALAIWLAVSLLLFSGGAAAWAVSAAGDGQHLWLAQPWDDEAGTLVAHHGPGDGRNELGQARKLSRTVAPHGLAARGARLYVIYTNGTMQLFDGQRTGMEQLWRYQTRPAPSLPRGTSIRSLAVGRSGPWALVRVETAEVLRRLDAPAAERPTEPELTESQMLRNLRLGLPPNMPLAPPPDADEPAEEAEDEATENDAADEVSDDATDDNREADASPDPDADPDAEPAAEADAEAVAVDRLLRMRAGRWEPVALPDDWPAEGRARLVASPQAEPWLVVQPEGHTGLAVYRWNAAGDEPGWERTSYDVPVTEQWSAAAVGGHLVTAWQTSEADADTLRVEAAVLRHGRVRPIGALDLEGPHRAWAVAGTEAALWLVAQHTEAVPPADDAAEPAPPPWRWTSMSLQGTVGATPDALQWRMPEGMGGTADYVIMVGVLVSAVLLMLLFWRRDAAANQLALPETAVLGALGKRFLAALLDLLPAILLVMLAYDLTVPELMMRWPGGGAATSWQAIEPGVLAVGLFVLYTTCSELLMQRTVGKVIFGLRVSDLQGQRPRFWQLLVRNLLKSFDLVAWPLLILLVLGPYRQRLGDLVARTVVITRAPGQDDEQTPENEHKDDD